jgi:glutamine synthetase
MVAMPDPDTWQLLPWNPPDHRATARMFCDILMPGGQPFEGDPRYVLKMSAEERQKRGIGTLPGSLAEALQLAEGSKLVREALGEHVFNSFIENKKKEWDEYRTQVTEYELKKYMPIM